jgi:hypothetical protein
MLAQTSRPTSAVGGSLGVSGAGDTCPARMVAAASHVVAAQRMPLGTMCLELVGKAAFLRGVQKILALRSEAEEKSVRGVDQEGSTARTESRASDQIVLEQVCNSEKAVGKALGPGDLRTRLSSARSENMTIPTSALATKSE